MSVKLLENLDMTWSEDSVRYINTPSKKAKGLYFYVQEVGDFRARSPYYTERSNLDSYLIILTLNGTGKLFYQDNVYFCRPDTLMYISCMNHHKYECIGDEDWDFLWLHFNGPSALGYYEEFTSAAFRPIHISSSDGYEDKLREILRLCQEKGPHYEPKISLLITELLTLLIIKNAEENRSGQNLPGYLDDSINYMEKHFAESLSLDALSDICHINKYHFAKQFARYMQISPNEYLIVIRLNHAKELLKYSTHTIEEISELCGFNQCSHFIRTFKTRIGMTPLKYRKKWNQ